MRVCMLAYTHYEHDNRVIRYAEALAGRGDHVDVLAVGKRGQTPHEVIRGVNVYRIQRRVVNETMPLSFLIKIMAFVLNSGLRLGWMHVRNKYDVIHIHSVPDFLVFSALIPKLFGAKCILDVHDIVPEFYADKFGVDENALVFKGLLWVEKISARFVDHVIVANDIWAERLTARSVPAEKCSVFLNYPDQTHFAKKPDVTKNDKFVMIYPGTLSPHQGLDIAIRAMPKIGEQAPEAQLQIYGNGRHKEALVHLSEELGVTDKVVFNELLPMSEIANVMASADLAVVPKRADSFGNEAFSTKILEFMSLGVPVLAADTTIDKYYFNDSEIQFFESGNEDSFAERALELIRDPESLERIARNAEHCAAKYSWSEHKQRYFDLVDSWSAVT